MLQANPKRANESSIGMLIGSTIIVLAVAALYPTSPLRRMIHDSLLRQVLPPRTTTFDSLPRRSRTPFRS